MKNLSLRHILFMVVPVILISFGCSNSSDNPIAPVDTPPRETRDTGAETERVLWGIWSITCDVETMEVSITPDRNALTHFDVTDMVNPPACDDCLEISVNSFDPVTREMDVDVTLINQYLITGKDVRGILYTNDLGHLLLNPDNWTDLWDIPGGHPANINPFKAFAKAVPQHVFGAGQEYTENYIVYIPKPPQYAAIRYAVDASWPGNCKEPYSVKGFNQAIPIYDVVGSWTALMIMVRDWQNDIDDVVIQIPEITGEASTSLSDQGSDWWMTVIYNNESAEAGDYTALIIAESAGSGDSALYEEVTVTVTEALTPEVTGIEPNHGTIGATLLDVTITGNNFQGPGGEVWLIKAGEPSIPTYNKVTVDENTTTCNFEIPFGQKLGLYDVAVINPCFLGGIGMELFEVLGQLPHYPVDVTPEWLNYTANDVAISGQYTLIASRFHGVQVIDVGNPSDPFWVVNIPVEDQAAGIDVVGDYAYVADYEAGLKIINIGLVDFGKIEGSVSSIGQARKVTVQDGYAFVACYTSGLRIIDVDPPEDATVVVTVPTGQAFDVAVDGNYAYVADGSNGLCIVDIDPIEDASIVKTVDTGDDHAAGVALQSGYAYVACKSDGLVIVDVDPVGTADVVHTVATGYFLDIAVVGDYAYAADRSEGLTVVDISTPETASELTSLPTGSWSYAITVDHDYAYIADPLVGLRVINISTPASPSLEGTAYGLGYAKDVEYAGGYAYVANQAGGLFVFGAMPPPFSFFIGTIDTAETKGLCVDAGYVYLADWTSNFKIIDISNPADPVIAKDVLTPGVSYDAVLDSGYIYLADGPSGLVIIDVDPIGDASVIKTVDTPDRAISVAVSGGYAYVSDEDEGVQIIDIEPIADASIVHSISTTAIARGIVVDSNYAYLAESIDGLVIIDITTPESASIEKTVTLPGSAKGIYVDGGFAYITCSTFGVQIVDVSTVADAYIFSSVDTPDNATNVWVEGPYALVADEWGGLRIIQLW